ncbi:MAG: sigma-70 family RNA polymerase sigma factor [Muribaculaceae bacterium]|nr:sigma-70 family RNA polymerase sigma factor [Muribaculaceae bacterium]
MANKQRQTVISSEELLSRVVAGDPAAVEQLYREHHEQLLLLALHYVHDVDAARDVEHDAWVMILTSLATLRETSRLPGWMRSIVRNTALNYLKHEQVARQVPLVEAGAMDEDSDGELPVPPIPVMMDMVQRLPLGYEQVFRLHTFDGLTHEQIGDLLGIAASTSRSQLSRARDLLQQMLHRYWALMVAALLAPIAALLILNQKKNDMTTPPSPTTTTHHDEWKAEMETNIAVTQPTLANRAPASPTTPSAVMPAPIVPDEGSTARSDSLPSALLTASDVTARILNVPQIAWPTRTIAPANIAAWHGEEKTPRRKPWQMNLAYGGSGGMTSSVTDNFLAVVNFAGGETDRGMRLYTWGDYYRYVDENASLMDSVDASRMTAIAERHASELGDPPPEGDQDVHHDYNDRTPLSETKHHERPRTIQLSLAVPLSQRWSLNSGLGFTWMKSTFEADNGNGNDITRRTQRLNYLNVPIGATYTIWQRNRLSVYASGSLRLDIPVRGRETTEWVYIGPFEHAPGDSLVFPSTHATIKAPWQWSVGAGVGVQYQLLPHVKAYFEPGFRYYIPTGSPVETYRTVHPFDVAFPFGIRITP